MARIRNLRPASWPVIVGVGLLVVAAWGFYAWRYAGGSQSGGQHAESFAGTDGLSAAGADADAGITPLRATRPEIAADDHGGPPSRADREVPQGDARAAPRALMEPADPSGSISVNAPPLSLEPLEMTIDRIKRRPARPASQEIQVGRAALARGDLVSARAAFSGALAGDPGASEAARARTELERIAEALLFSRSVVADDPLTGTTVVRAGETLNAIARRLKVTEALLASINRITDPNLIRAGARLKVIHGPFHAVIRKSAHRMDVYLADAFVRSFRVGLGTNGGTPLGTWAVTDKLKNPEWTDPMTGRRYLADDPENPIGERWIGLLGIAGESVGKVGFGIHGTIDPASIGENFSMGCIRLLPDDVAVVYDLLVDRHSKVTIK